jgi:hypothetical protein
MRVAQARPAPARPRLRDLRLSRNRNCSRCSLLSGPVRGVLFYSQICRAYSTLGRSSCVPIGGISKTAASGYTPLTPDRLLDTRNGTGGTSGALPAGKSLSLTVAGADHGLLPSTGITAVALNVTVADATGNGFLTTYPDGKTKPNTSNLNFVAGDVRSANIIVQVGADGKIDIAQGGTTGSTQVIADVEGYFSESSTNTYVPATPTRVLDTRTNLSDWGQCVLLDDEQLPGSPDDVAAVILNMTVTQTTSPGWLVEVPANETTKSAPANFGCTGLNPTTSDVNWTTANATVPNLDIAQPATDAQMAFYFGGSQTNPPQLVIDAFGIFGKDVEPGTL